MIRDLDWRRYAPAAIAAVAFVVLYWEPMATLLRDWWGDPDAGHGLLLGPLAGWLLWKRGLAADRQPQPWLGLAVLAGAVFLRYVSGLAAELFTMRFSLLLGLAGGVIFVWGFRQLLHWWLPATLMFLSIPLPDVLVGTLALPLQLKASQMGAALLEWRNVPVLLQGNVIHLPGQSLFVTEACSGLRSLTALLALGVLMSGLWLRTWWARAVLIVLALPVAIVLNGMRVFLTGFLVYYVDPALGAGVMHYTEGWAIFVFAFAIIGVLAWSMMSIEQRFLNHGANPVPT